MSSKVDMINALGQAEVARKKAQRSAYVPDLFLLERLNFFTQIPKQCPQSQACFGSFLARQLDSGVSSLGAKLPKLEEYWLKAAAVLELEKGLTAAPLYFTRILRDVLPLLGPDLRAQVEAYQAYQRYAARADPSSAAAALPPLLSGAVLGSSDGGTPAGGDSRSAGGTGLLRLHCVVHYRVGDMLSLHVNGGMIINPAAVAAAAASFAPAPTSVEILDGGVGWGVDGAVNSDDDPSSVISRSLGVRLMASDCIPPQVLFNLSRALQAALPSSRILPSTLRAADGDFFALTEADYVVVAGGSFGLLGAMAGKPGQQVRSPACDHHLDVAGSRRAPSPKPLRKGWLEYPYDLIRTRAAHEPLLERAPQPVWRLGSSPDGAQDDAERHPGRDGARPPSLQYVLDGRGDERGDLPWDEKRTLLPHGVEPWLETWRAWERWHKIRTGDT